jgi:tellurite resistance protein
MFRLKRLRPPPIRSSFSGESAPVVTEIIHRPGFWRAYGVQTAMCGIVLLLGFFGVVMGIFASDKATSFAQTMILPSVILMILGGVMPFLFYGRYRKMELVFKDAALDVEGGATADDTADIVAHHPNRGRFVHSSWINLLVGTLVALSFLELVAGFVLLFNADLHAVRVNHGTRLDIYSTALIGQGVANLGLAYAIWQHRMRALGWVILFSVVNVVTAVATLEWILMVYAVVTCAIFWGTGLALRKVDAEIATPHKSDPLEAYYHNLLGLLVRVMRADGHCDRRELSKISRLCNDMNLSDYERDLVVTSANEHPAEPLEDVVMRYRIAAEVAQIPDPTQSLVVAALAVATADGILVPEERAVLEDLAKLLDVDAALFEAALGPHAPPDSMNEDFARSLLNVTENDPAETVAEAYRSLRSELHAAHYTHLGSHLAQTLNKRLLLVDEAHDLLVRHLP